jgi:hypothetical protein
MSTSQAVLGAFQIAAQIEAFGAARKAARRQREHLARNTQLAYEDLDLQAIEMQQAVAEKASLRARQGIAERGRLAAVFADSGVVGNTQMRIRGESLFNEGDDISSMQSNLRKGINQIKRQKLATYENATQQLAGIQRPSVLGLLGGISSTVASSASLSSGAGRVGTSIGNWSSGFSSRFRIDGGGGRLIGDAGGVQGNINRIYGST